MGNIEEAAHHADELRLFSPGFLATILRGELILIRNAEQNKLLLEGLGRSGLPE